MPKIRRTKKRPPEGWELIEPRHKNTVEHHHSNQNKPIKWKTTVCIVLAYESSPSYTAGW